GCCGGCRPATVPSSSTTDRQTAPASSRRPSGPSLSRSPGGGSAPPASPASRPPRTPSSASWTATAPSTLRSSPRSPAPWPLATPTSCWANGSPGVGRGPSTRALPTARSRGARGGDPRHGGSPAMPAPAQATGLLVFAKEPVVGRAKTRLSPPLTPAGAARLAAAMLDDTLAAVSAVPAVRPVLVVDGDP